MKTILWLITIPLLLVLILIVLLQFPDVQTFVTSKATSFLSGKIHTKVELKKLSIDFPKSIALEDLYVEDQLKDTLLYAHQLKVDINLLDLLSKKIVVNTVDLNTITGHITRSHKDSAFNFQFIVNAFSSPKEKTNLAKKDTTSSPWEFSLKTVELHAIYFTYHDALTGTNADLNFGGFKTEVDKLDLNKKDIRINTIVLKNTNLNFNQKTSYKVPESKTPSKPFDYNISLNSLELAGINAIYTNALNNQQAALALGDLIIKPGKIDILNERIDVKSLALANTTAKYLIGKKNVSTIDTAATKADTLPTAQPNWIITLGQLDLSGNHFYFDNNTFPKTKSGVDYNHIAATHFNLHATDLYGNAKASHLNLQELSFKEQCGFQIKKFSGNLTYDTTHIDASNLHIETNKSTIRDHLAIRYKSIQDIGKNVGNLYVSAQLKSSDVTVSDILYFVPNLLDIKALNFTPQTKVKLTANIKGIINDLSLQEFTLFTPKNTIVKLKGSLKQVLHPNRMYIDLPLIDITSTQADLFSIISKQLIPETITLPETFAVSGNASGYLNNFNTDLSIHTSMGNIMAHIKMNPKAGNIEQPYSGNVKAEHFNVGKLIGQQETLGEITTNLSFNGSGLSAKTINTQINLEVEKALVKGYEYTTLKADGLLLKKSFTGKAAMNDKNLAFNFDGSFDFDSVSPKYIFTLDLKGADFKALHFSEEDLRISTFIKSNLQQQGDNITGFASLKNTLLVKNNRKHPIDSIVLRSDYKEGISEISLQSGIVEAGLKGTLSMNEIAASFKQFINGYFNLKGTPTQQQLKPQKFDYHINLLDPTLLTESLIPGIQEMSPAFVTGSYNSLEKKLITDVSIPHINYSGTKTDSLKINIHSTATALNYALTSTEVSNPVIKLENIALLGKVQDNTINFQLSTSKDDSINVLAVGGTFKNNTNSYELKLNPELTLNSEKWNINPENYLSFLPEGLIANELNIKNGAQLIEMNSLTKVPEAPIKLDFKDFDLSTISKMLENKKELIKGKVNGNIVLEKQNNVSAFSSDIVITDFAFQSVPIGTIKLKANNKQNAQVYDMDLSIEGSRNSISGAGRYNVASKENALDFLLDIKNMNMQTIEPFTFGQVSRMSGTLNGKLNIKGGIETPDLNGHLHFKQSAMNPKFIDSYLSIPDAELTFSNKKVIFENFKIIDSLNNSAIISGNADIKDFSKIGLDLRLRSDNFLALNTTIQDNPLYFGTVFLDSDVSIKGTTDSPTIKAKAKLNKGSVITYVKPDNEVGKEENKGIIEFVDSLSADKTIMSRQNDTIQQLTALKGIDIDAALTFDKNVQLKMLVDPSSGDSLYIVGSGTLNFVLDKSGKTTLTGKYKIDDGGYHLTISEFIKRDFKIEPGSSVSWSGDILDAYVDIKAIYTIKTSPIDLVQSDLAGVDELERNKYRNLLTFLVYLKMTGFLSTPEIGFDIQLAPKDKGAVSGSVNAKLEELRGDETQLNKQVFALLTLSRFISDNPLDNGGGGGLSSTSRTSASKVLTQQLSSLSQKYVKGIDLDLGVNSFEDYSTGQEQGRTQLQIGVSKQLFNEKVTVRVGGNVELEGEKAKQNNASDVAGNISIDYKLTDDGRYKLRGFRQNQYENPIEGEIIKTGVGVVYVKNYNKLRELFSKPKSSKKPTEVKTK
ncbi:MAG: translocation/assembly module TamB domain-containing protein [Bacteroidota bacterium]